MMESGFKRLYWYAIWDLIPPNRYWDLRDLETDHIHKEYACTIMPNQTCMNVYLSFTQGKGKSMCKLILCKLPKHVFLMLLATTCLTNMCNATVLMLYECGDRGYHRTQRCCQLHYAAQCCDLQYHAKLCAFLYSAALEMMHPLELDPGKMNRKLKDQSDVRPTAACVTGSLARHSGIKVAAHANIQACDGGFQKRQEPFKNYDEFRRIPDHKVQCA